MLDSTKRTRTWSRGERGAREGAAGRAPRVVDLGCGAGRDYPAFEERGIDYLGVDASEGMLTVARERFPSAAFEAQDLCRLDLPERSFDGAFANASLQHVPTPALPNALSQTSMRASGRAESYDLRPARQGRRGLVASTIKGNESLGRLALAGDARTVLRGRGLRIRHGAHGPVPRGSSFRVFVWRRPVDDGPCECPVVKKHSTESYKTAACNSSGACPAGGGAAISRRLSIRPSSPGAGGGGDSPTLAGILAGLSSAPPRNALSRARASPA